MDAQTKKFTAKVKGGNSYVIHARTEGEALLSLVRDIKIPVTKLSYMTCEDEKDTATFLLQVGTRDYTVEAEDARSALTAFAKMGLNMNKARNLRRQ